MDSYGESSECIGRIVDDIYYIACSGMKEYQRWTAVDVYIRTVPLTEMDTREILTVCRTTYPMRLNLAYWRALVLKAHAKLKADGENADQLLKGLLNA